jgi:hypothetical protein
VTDFRLNPAIVSSRKSKLVSNTLVWNGFKDGFTVFNLAGGRTFARKFSAFCCCVIWHMPVTPRFRFPRQTGPLSRSF